MKIRSITFFFRPGWPLKKEEIPGNPEAFNRRARSAYDRVGYEVQYTRMATVPFPEYISPLENEELVQRAKELERMAKSLGYDYLSFGPATPDRPESYPLILEALAGTEVTFFSGALTTRDGGVSLPAIKACARIIHQAASISPDGFTNLRFAALANVPPGSPFFPAAYHDGNLCTFALALEAADLAVEAVKSANSLEAVRQALIDSIEGHTKNLVRIADELTQEFGLPFGGIDFTLAPYPEKARSFATAMEDLGVPATGQRGSLAAAAFFADALDRAQFPRAGFSGLMFPVLEDWTLGRRAAEGLVSVSDLLLYSAVCGTGLDTVPLPGDISEDALAAILLDLAALAQRLDKPLTARLMPIPGKQAGEATDFDFEYFAPGKIMDIKAGRLSGLLSGDETFSVHPRRVS